MTDQSETRSADKELTAAILILGPVISYIGWMVFGIYISGGLLLYIFVSVLMIFLFAIWAWKGKPTWPYFA